jgi:hypothetical protein
LAATAHRATLPRLARSALLAVGAAAVLGSVTTGCGTEEAPPLAKQDAGDPNAYSGGLVYGGAPPDDAGAPVDAARDSDAPGDDAAPLLDAATPR